MKRDRNQYTLRSLMAVVATFALLLSVPRENWLALGSWIPNLIAMLVMVFVGFSVAYIGCKLASGIGIPMEESPPGREKSAP
jgi:hypothetical protein